jgi:arylsulfatase A-like enzyme
MEKSNPRVPSWQAVRDNQWKYIHYPEVNGGDELYDLKKDPYEMQNMVHDAPAVLTEKKQQLDKYNEQIK